MRIETLNPWPYAVDGAALADELRQRFLSHVVFGDDTDVDVAVLWVFGTYLMDVWELFPRLMITSPTKECGKTRLQEVLAACVYRALPASNATASTIFRAIEAWQPTLLFDEADTWMRDKPELVGILNSGHSREGAQLLRTEEVKGARVPVQFSTWAAMSIACIGTQHHTLMSRSIVINLRRKMPSDKAPGGMEVTKPPIGLRRKMLAIRRRLARWAEDHKPPLLEMDCEPPVGSSDRRQDNFTPLWRIASELGGEWPGRVAAAYRAQGKKDANAEEPADVMLLRDIMELFLEHPGIKIDHDTAHRSADLLAWLNDREDRPWGDWKGKSLTKQGMSAC